MLFNTDKCKVLHFDFNNPHIDYTMDGVKLQLVKENQTLACGDIMPTGWTPAAASSTLEEWTRTFSRGQQRSCFITVLYGVRAGEQKVCELGQKIWKI